MPPEVKEGAIEEASPASKNGANDGDSPSPDELKAENKRKAEKIASLETEIKADRARLAKLEAIEEQRELTAREEREKAVLKDDVGEEAKKLREMKETQPWIKISKDEAKEASTDAVLNNEIERSNDFLEDMASDNKMEVEQFAKEIRKFSSPYMNKRPERRTVLAYRDWQKAQSKEKSLSEREQKLKEKEDAETSFRERGGRIPRDESLQTEMDK